MTTTRPLNVLLVANLYPDEIDPAKGVFVKNIENSLVEEGFNVTTIALKNKLLFNSKLLSYFIFYLNIFITVLTKKHDLLYPHYVSHCAPPILAARIIGFRPKIVSHVHGSDILSESGTRPHISYIKNYFAKNLLQSSKLIIAPSLYYKTVIADKFNIDPNLILVSPSGGVDLSVFHPVIRTGEIRSTFHLGFVSRLIEEKGVTDFLLLLSSLVKLGIPVKATIIGDGPLRNTIESFQPKQIINYIPSLKQDELASIYQQLDLFVFPTRRHAESLGLVGIEAMACGVPVLAYRGAGPETYVLHYKNGFLVDIGNITDLVNFAIEYFNSQSIARDSLRKQAVLTAQSFSSSIVKKQLASAMRNAYINK